MLESLLYGAGYALAGIGLLVAGYFMLDVLTPGRLGHKVYAERSVNGAVILSATFLGLGAIEFTAIWTNAASGFGSALGWTVAFGLLGVVLQGISFLLLDLLTPGSLGRSAAGTATRCGW